MHAMPDQVTGVPCVAYVHIIINKPGLVADAEKDRKR